jgi:tRNA modification GTPase
LLLTDLQQRIGSLEDSFQYGNAIKNGVPVVIAGRPNAGKSTLLNALLKEERAIVSEIAGTTRDTIEEVITISGVQFRIIDTAGLRHTTDNIEAMGVARAREKVKQARILLYLFDREEMTSEEVIAEISTLENEGLKIIICPAKSDTYTKDDGERWIAALKPLGHTIISISGKTGINLETLKYEMLDAVGYHHQPANNLVVTNARHYQALHEVNQSLRDIMNGLEQGLQSDLVAIDIHRCLHYLGEITGQVNNEEILGNIFGKFCIGK